MSLKKINTRKASTILEYAIIIGIVSIAMIWMNTYIKRGVQAKTKMLTDNFISDQQESSEDESTDYYSNTSFNNTRSVNVQGFKGGRVRTTTLADNMDINSDTNTTDNNGYFVGIGRDSGSGTLVGAPPAPEPVTVAF